MVAGDRRELLLPCGRQIQAALIDLDLRFQAFDFLLPIVNFESV